MHDLLSALNGRVFESSLGYRLMQAPFAQRKLAPVLADADAARARRALDVGCGPGTNTLHFEQTEYLGVDLSEAYVRSARGRYQRNFIVADVSRAFLRGATFDCILSNSLLHHLDDASVRATLRNLSGLLASDGHIYVLDLVLPPSKGVAYMLAKADRGDYPRRLGEWRELFTEFFELEVFFPYPLGVPGLCLWNMVYFKGRPKS